jgi:3-dehydroquinate dehydratase-2
MTKNTTFKKILVIHGPNLNLLGRREPDIYGDQCLNDIDAALKAQGEKMGLSLESFQSNHEGAIVDRIQQAADSFHGIIINPAAYTHTSIAIRDALLMLDMPVVEIHLSNIQNREPFRRVSMIADIVTGSVSGFGPQGYLLALEGLAQNLSRSDPVVQRTAKKDSTPQRSL